MLHSPECPCGRDTPNYSCDLRLKPLAKSRYAQQRDTLNSARRAARLTTNFENRPDFVAVDKSVHGPSLPRRSPAFVSLIRCLAAALGRWPTRQLMTPSRHGGP